MKITLSASACGAVMMAATILCAPASADCDFLKPHCADHEGCGSCGPVWLCCQGQPKTVNTTRHCYDVECEYVCIPPVTLPACCRFLSDQHCAGDSCAEDCAEGCDDDCGESCDSCSPPNLLQRVCAKFTDCRIRKVHRLKKQEQDIQECEWEWSVVRMAAPGCCKDCGESCCPPVSCCAPCSIPNIGGW